MAKVRPQSSGVLGLVLSLALAACSRDLTIGTGATVYDTPLADGNSFACATCHALGEPAADGLRRPGHPIGDATRRAHWKNGKAATFLDAVNSCVTEWMVASAWTAKDPRFVALRDYLDARTAAAHAPDLSFEIVAPPTDLSSGDAARGRATFDKTCVVCHGPGGGGTDRGPRVAQTTRAAAYIAGRVRTSGSATSLTYAGLTGGVMPFWAKDRLDDGEIRDLIAFLRGGPADAGAAETGTTDARVPDAGAPQDAAPEDGTSDVRVPDAGASDATTADTDATAVPSDAKSDKGDAPVTSKGCAKTNARIGWKANLGVNTGEGQVGGFVTMIDDCTLELSDFSYDGNGIEVRVYGSKVKTFKPGFAIGPDLFGHVFSKATLRVTLPTGRTLDDLDWVSIWCIRASANFGSGPFLPPT